MPKKRIHLSGEGGLKEDLIMYSQISGIKTLSGFVRHLLSHYKTSFDKFPAQLKGKIVLLGTLTGKTTFRVVQEAINDYEKKIKDRGQI